jgi:isocitrate lyase
MYSQKEISDLEKEWSTNPRWKGITRTYTAEDVIKLQGSTHIDYTLARIGSEKLWNLFQKEPFIRALGALSGNQAVQMVQAGLKAIYASGWQVAADANDAAQTYPDQSLYPCLSMPHLIQRINNALMRADQIEHMKNGDKHDWFAPIVADAEAGFGGPLNTYELIRSMIEAGASAIHLEDQLSSVKKCGHMGGKVLVPGKIFIEKLIAARLAADVLRIPLIIIARTDAHSAKLIRSDYDEVDKPFLTGERSPDGYYFLKDGLTYAIQRGIDFAPYSDLIWCETSTPDLGEAKEFADGIHEKFPGKWLAYNCSPSFNWKAKLDDKSIRSFQEKLGELGYKFQFVTLAGFHTLNASMFNLAIQYQKEGMAAYSRFQQTEFALEKESGYSAIKHQQFVGAGYYDEITNVLSQGQSSTTALAGSTEEEQF